MLYYRSFKQSENLVCEYVMNAFDLILINLPCLLKMISSKSLVFLALALISLYVISNIVFGIEFMGNGIGRVHGEDSFPKVEEI